MRTLLALTLLLLATPALAQDFTLLDPSLPTLPTLQLRRGPFSEGPITNVIDIGFRDDNRGTMTTRNGLDIRGYADPWTDTDTKWQAAEFQISVPDGNTARMTRNIASAIFRATYFGDGWLDSMYGLHVLSLVQRGAGDVDNVYGTWTNVGTAGVASGHVKTATGHYVPGCLRGGTSVIEQCVGIWIRPQTMGQQNWALISEGTSQFNGPVLLLLDGTVKPVTQGAPDSCGIGRRCLTVGN